MTAATPFWYLYTQAVDWPTGLGLLILPLLLNIFYLAPALALVNNSVKPSQRTMSSAILLMVLNFIGLGGGPTLVGILSTNFSADKVAAGMDKALAGAEGLRDALLWMTPFFAVAVFFMVLQYLALRREVQADGPVSDGGFATGVLLLLVGVAGLGARYYFGGVTGMTSTDVVPLLQMIMLVVATVLGLFLLLGAGGRKKAAA